MVKTIEDIMPKTLKENLKQLDEIKKTFKNDKVKPPSIKLINRIKSILKKIKIQPTIVASDNKVFNLVFKNRPRHTVVIITISEVEIKSKITFSPSDNEFYLFENIESFKNIRDTVRFINNITKYNFLI